MKPIEVPSRLQLFASTDRKMREEVNGTPRYHTFAEARGDIQYEFTDMARKLERYSAMLRKLAQDAWMRQDFATNAAICRLLGERTAEEHETDDLKCPECGQRKPLHEPCPHCNQPIGES